MHLNLFTSLIVFLIFYTINVIAQTANPTRPSAADNAYLAEYGFTEIEIGYSGDDKTFSIPTLLKFTPFQKLEAGVLLSGLLNYDGNETKVGDPGIQLKYQILNKEKLALSFVGKVAFSSSSPATYTIYGVPTIQTDIVQIDVTAGTSFFKDLLDYKNLYFYAVALSPKTELPFGLFLEVYGESHSNYSPIYFDFGIGYPISSDFVLDVALAVGLNEDANAWILQFGFTKTMFRLF